jgi:hypothetical protein
MAANKKPRKKYKPRLVYVNPVGFVLENLSPVAHHDSFLLDLKIKNHGALASMMQGVATRADIDTLIQMVNVSEALARHGFGKEYREVIANGILSIRSVGLRGHTTGKYIMKAEEIKALNDLMELHDAQMEVITVGDMDKAIQHVNEELKHKRATPIIKRAA